MFKTAERKEYPILATVRDRVPGALARIRKDGVIAGAMPSTLTPSFYVAVVNKRRHEFIRLRINPPHKARSSDVVDVQLNWDDSDADVERKILRVLQKRR